MPNATPTIRITTCSRFMLLALGAISLSSLMTLPASAQFIDPNASGCRSVVGIAIGRPCLSARPENNGVAQHGSNADGAGGGYGATDAIKQVLDAKQALELQREQQQEARDAARRADSMRAFQQLLEERRTGSRVAAPPPPDGRTNATATPPKVAVTTSTTFDKATNTTTRDHRTGATAAPGGPPPAAAIVRPPPAAALATKPTAAPQMAAQSVVRDHRH